MYIDVLQWCFCNPNEYVSWTWHSFLIHCQLMALIKWLLLLKNQAHLVAVVVRKTISTPFIWSQLPISVITVPTCGTKQFMSSYEMPFGLEGWKNEKLPTQSVQLVSWETRHFWWSTRFSRQLLCVVCTLGVHVRNKKIVFNISSLGVELGNEN